MAELAKWPPNYPDLPYVKFFDKRYYERFYGRCFATMCMFVVACICVGHRMCYFYCETKKCAKVIVANVLHEV